MYHYDPETALEELREEGLLPNAVHMRDMVFRAHLDMEDSVAVNRKLQEFIAHFGEALVKGREILEALSTASQKRSIGRAG